MGYFTVLDWAHASILLDLYGQLLTPRQREVMVAYYEDDLSIGEIAENRGISRPGVHDLLRRSVNQLQNLESKLRLAQKEKQRREATQTARQLVEELAVLDKNPEVLDKLRAIRFQLARLEEL